MICTISYDCAARAKDRVKSRDQAIKWMETRRHTKTTGDTGTRRHTKTIVIVQQPRTKDTSDTSKCKGHVTNGHLKSKACTWGDEESGASPSMITDITNASPILITEASQEGSRTEATRRSIPEVSLADLLDF